MKFTKYGPNGEILEKGPDGRYLPSTPKPPTKPEEKMSLEDQMLAMSYTPTPTGSDGRPTKEGIIAHAKKVDDLQRRIVERDKISAAEKKAAEKKAEIDKARVKSELPKPAEPLKPSVVKPAESVKEKTDSFAAKLKKEGKERTERIKADFSEKKGEGLFSLSRLDFVPKKDKEPKAAPKSEEPEAAPKSEEPKVAPKPEEPKAAPKPEKPKKTPKPKEPKEAPKRVKKVKEPISEPAIIEKPKKTRKPKEPKLAGFDAKSSIGNDPIPETKEAPKEEKAAKENIANRIFGRLKSKAKGFFEGGKKVVENTEESPELQDTQTDVPKPDLDVEKQPLGMFGQTTIYHANKPEEEEPPKKKRRKKKGEVDEEPTVKSQSTDPKSGWDSEENTSIFGGSSKRFYRKVKLSRKEKKDINSGTNEIEDSGKTSKSDPAPKSLAGILNKHTKLLTVIAAGVKKMSGIKSKDIDYEGKLTDKLKGKTERVVGEKRKKDKNGIFDDDFLKKLTSNNPFVNLPIEMAKWGLSFISSLGAMMALKLTAFAVALAAAYDLYKGFKEGYDDIDTQKQTLNPSFDTETQKTMGGFVGMAKTTGRWLDKVNDKIFGKKRQGELTFEDIGASSSTNVLNRFGEAMHDVANNPIVPMVENNPENQAIIKAISEQQKLARETGIPTKPEDVIKPPTPPPSNEAIRYQRQEALEKWKKIRQPIIAPIPPSDSKTTSNVEREKGQRGDPVGKDLLTMARISETGPKTGSAADIKAYGKNNKDGEGYSYGAYQFHSLYGLKEFLPFLKQKYPKFAKILYDAGGIPAAQKNSPKFVAAWEALANNKEFHKAQDEGILELYGKPVFSLVKSQTGLDFSKKSLKIQSGIASMAINKGNQGAANIIKSTFSGANQQVVDSMSDKELANRIASSRALDLEGSKNRGDQGLWNRIENEKISMGGDPGQRIFKNDEGITVPSPKPTVELAKIESPQTGKQLYTASVNVEEQRNAPQPQQPVVVQTSQQNTSVQNNTMITPANPRGTESTHEQIMRKAFGGGF